MDSQLLDYPSVKFTTATSTRSTRDEKLEIFSTDLSEITRITDELANLIYLRTRINDIRRINRHLILINKKLQMNGLLVCHFETIEQRNRRMREKYGKLARLLYPVDFVYKRIFPKIGGLKKVYFFLSKGRNRVLSKAEVLGRLHYCGFHIVNIEEVDDLLHLIVKKVKEPRTDLEPSYSPIYKKLSYGQNGKTIYIYKFRTMHPYSEYLREYILRTNGYATSGDGIGKIDNDFRVTRWGKMLRKYWLDELPQVMNILKGDLKLVGIRPLTKSFLAEYPEDFLKERMKYKMGLLPPYAAHIHKSIDEYIDSERKYLAAYQKHPILTDVKYFFWITFNILTNKIRSQ